MKTLEELRREIDAIDEQLHDLFMRRTKIVEGVRAAKKGEKIKIRPAREAEIVYRLLERHSGAFPRRELVRIWRELIVATLRSEGPFSCGVFVGEDCEGFWDIARDQYGSFTPMKPYSSIRHLIEEVRDQKVTVGVLPLPVKRDPDPWWRRLAANGDDVPRIIARLPFAGPGNARSKEREALVICPVGQEPTGRDRTYMVVESGRELAAAPFGRMASAAGLKVVSTAGWSDPSRPQIWLKLVELEGCINEDDPDILKLVEKLEKSGPKISRVIKLGGYATPLDEDELGTEPGGKGK